MTKEELEKKRDVYFDRMVKTNDPRLDYLVFIEGWNAAVDILMPEIEKAEKTGLQKAARIAELAASEFWHEQSTLMGDGAEMVKFRINHALAALEGK